MGPLKFWGPCHLKLVQWDIQKVLHTTRVVYNIFKRRGLFKVLHFPTLKVLHTKWNFLLTKAGPTEQLHVRNSNNLDFAEVKFDKCYFFIYSTYKK